MNQLTKFTNHRARLFMTIALVATGCLPATVSASAVEDLHNQRVVCASFATELADFYGTPLGLRQPDADDQRAYFSAMSSEYLRAALDSGFLLGFEDEEVVAAMKAQIESRIAELGQDSTEQGVLAHVAQVSLMAGDCRAAGN